MQTTQNLNNYTALYTTYKGWGVKKTPHYIFYFTSDSPAEKEIELIASRQESAYTKIHLLLNTDFISEPIRYYIYPSEELKKELMGDDGYAQAIWHDNSVHIVYTDSIKPLGEHEDTHLLTLSWGVSFGLLQEGLAEYTSGCVWHGVDEDMIARDEYEKGSLPAVPALMSHDAWVHYSENREQILYPLAGSFVRFLIQSYGLEVFKKIYKETNRQNTIDQNVSVIESCCENISTLENNFRQYLSLTSCQK